MRPNSGVAACRATLVFLAAVATSGTNSPRPAAFESFAMLKNFVRTVTLGLLAAGGLISTASAQEAVMDEFYGDGVHNFYDRDFFQAMQNLSVAIDGGSKDPRAYYYR